MKKVVPKDAVLVPEQAAKVFKGIIYDTYQWPQKLFDDSSATFEMLKRPDTVSAVCMVDGKILVLKEEQPHSGTRISFPGGRVDESDLSPLAAAQREVLEETGYSFKNWKLIQVRQILVKVEWFIYYFLATEADNIGATKHDAGEKIRLEKMSFAQVKNLSLHGIRFVSEGRELFEDSKSIDDLLQLPEFVGRHVDR
jgi:ADP-ribose pyrophosphatase